MTFGEENVLRWRVGGPQPGRRSGGAAASFLPSPSCAASSRGGRSAGDGLPDGYDTHTDNELQNKKIVPEFDRALAALIEDLEERGRLDTTLVLVIGDFGHTPKVNFSGGRDHWPRACSIALAGAGIQGGALIGVTVEDVGATMYKALGIDGKKIYMAGDRPVALNKEGEPINELWS